MGWVADRVATLDEVATSGEERSDPGGRVGGKGRLGGNNQRKGDGPRGRPRGEVATSRYEGRWTGWQSAWQCLNEVATTSEQGGGKSTLKRELEGGGSKGHAGGGAINKWVLPPIRVAVSGG
jgi:hypothetical protein